jgi:multidrug efflux pump subunit AcrA (membrane-fusion protein)
MEISTMFEGNTPRPDHQGVDGRIQASPDAAPGEHTLGWKVWQVLKTVQARLRFIAILVIIGLVIGNWTTLNNFYEKWMRPTGAAEAGDPDAEWFCPMHPQIVRDKPGEKCPICHMDLAKRKKGSGEPEALPPGIVSRVQLTPYRVVLAGVQTFPVRRLPLVKELTTFGSVEFNEKKQAHIAATQKGRILKLYVNYTGQNVTQGEKLALLDVKYSRELSATLEDLLRARRSGNTRAENMARRRLRLWDVSDGQIKEFLSTGKVQTQLTIYSPIKGHVIKKYQREGNFVEEGTPLFDVDDLQTVWIEAQVYESDQALLHEGQEVTATTLALPNKQFHGTLDFIYPHLDESSRTLTVRFHMPNPGHQLRPGMYATVTLRIPPEKMTTFSKALAADAVKHKGRVLAVPDSAVIDTGRMKVVYREASPNVFEGVLVQLGPRMTTTGNPTVYYPVLKGLKEHDKIVTNGSFLIDAETRLNRAAGSIYFGGSGGSGGNGKVAVRPSTPEEVSAEDQRLIKAQVWCPITGKRLGSMGKPIRIMLNKQPVFLCCDGCTKEAKGNPARTLKKVEQLKARAKSSLRKRTEAAPKSPAPSAKEVKIKTNLAKLTAGDRRLAERQKLCPITGERLGSMGKPVKIMIHNKPVFLCCANCVEEARADPRRTLAKLNEIMGERP